MLHGACQINENVSTCTVCVFNSECLDKCLSQGEFAKIVHQGGENMIQQFVKKDGSCDMVCFNQIAQFAYAYQCILFVAVRDSVFWPCCVGIAAGVAQHPSP